MCVAAIGPAAKVRASLKSFVRTFGACLKFAQYIFLCFFYHLKNGEHLVFDLFKWIHTPIFIG